MGSRRALGWRRCFSFDHGLSVSLRSYDIPVISSIALFRKWQGVTAFRPDVVDDSETGLSDVAAHLGCIGGSRASARLIRRGLQAISITPNWVVRRTANDGRFYGEYRGDLSCGLSTRGAPRADLLDQSKELRR
jgi:hypothetical protein